MDGPERIWSQQGMQCSFCKVIGVERVDSQPTLSEVGWNRRESVRGREWLPTTTTDFYNPEILKSILFYCEESTPSNGFHFIAFIKKKTIYLFFITIWIKSLHLKFAISRSIRIARDRAHFEALRGPGRLRRHRHGAGKIELKTQTTIQMH